MNSLLENTKIKLIRDISDARLRKMADVIKPLVKVPNKREYPWWDYWTIKEPDLRNVAYTWESKLERMIEGFFDPLNSLKIISFHYWSYYGFFKPSIAEVMAAIYRFVPKWQNIRYFYLEDENMGPEHIIGDYHWCICRLFGDPVILQEL